MTAGLCVERGKRSDYLATGAVVPVTPVGAQAVRVPPLGLSPGGDGDGGAGGEGGEGQAGEEGVGQVFLAVVVSPALLRGQAGGARGRALQASCTASQVVVNIPGVPAPGAAVTEDRWRVGPGYILIQWREDGSYCIFEIRSVVLHQNE